MNGTAPRAASAQPVWHCAVPVMRHLQQSRKISRFNRLLHMRQELVTHRAREADLRATLDVVREVEHVHRVGSVLRVVGEDD